MPSSRRLASIATTMHCAPKRADARSIRAGSRTAAELSDTLSAPAASTARMSSSERRPPPIVNGMKTSSAVRRASSTIVPRPSWLAVMSRNTSSSAPSRS